MSDVGRRICASRRLKPARYIALYAALTTACVWPSPERQLLLDFFQACRAYDTTVLARFATVSCNPKTDGVVQEFEVVSVDRAPDARNVTIRARLRSLHGQVSEQTISVAMGRLDGRWMVTGLTPPPASQTSPAASSALPK
jgi:hypothetical protein